jgi:hypothetical protein
MGYSNSNPSFNLLAPLDQKPETGPTRAQPNTLSLSLLLSREPAQHHRPSPPSRSVVTLPFPSARGSCRAGPTRQLSLPQLPRPRLPLASLRRIARSATGSSNRRASPFSLFFPAVAPLARVTHQLACRPAPRQPRNRPRALPFFPPHPGRPRRKP